jgi:hypothetical protein
VDCAKTSTTKWCLAWAASALACSTLTCAAAPHGLAPDSGEDGRADGSTVVERGGEAPPFSLLWMVPPGAFQGRRFPALAEAFPADPAEWLVRDQVELRMQEEDDETRDRVVAAILAASRRSGMDPVLILAIIEVESGFDPDARSGRGALGLMQVRSATLWREAERSGLAGDDPHDPHLNVLAGTLYFRRLVRAFGPTDVALMAYNAGPNRVLGHLRAGAIPGHLLEYPRRVRAVEARLRRSLAGTCPPVTPGAPAPRCGRSPWSS